MAEQHEKTLVPQIRFAGFTDPWEQRKLGELTESYSGGTPAAGESEFYGGSIPFIRSAEIAAESTELFLTEKGYESSSARMVKPGDVLYALYGATSGEVAVSRQKGAINQAILAILPRDDCDARYITAWLRKQKGYIVTTYLQGGQGNLSGMIVKNLEVSIPSLPEQQKIGFMLSHLDSLITLHQRKYDGCTLSPIFFRKVHTMQENITSESLFCDYYAQWVRTYKEGAIRDVTMGKYRLTQSWLSKLIPELRLADMDRTAYQQLINGYAQHHERQTTMDFHHQIKGAILDAVDEGLIPRDPTRKVIIKGKQPRIKKMKYLNQFELHAMLADLDLGDEASWDWLILLIAKTGLRFSEALGLTPDDFDFAHQTLSVSKTWDYKNGGGFVPTKNESSVRKVQLDWQLIMQLSGLLKNLPHDKPIFVHGKVYNSTANDVLARHCKNVDVPVISIHGLRHTHASLLLFAGVSIASVSRRLGHASMTTTQETYLHVIRELENKDVDIVMRALSTLI